MISLLEFHLEISGKFLFVRTWHTYEPCRMLKNKMGIFCVHFFGQLYTSVLYYSDNMSFHLYVSIGLSK